MLKMNDEKKSKEGIISEPLIEKPDFEKILAELKKFKFYDKLMEDFDSNRYVALYGSSTEDLIRWETAMTDPRKHSREDGYRYLVHGVINENSISRTLQKLAILEEMQRGKKVNFDPVDLILNPEKIDQKHLISTSLIDSEKRATWAPGGYILKVPLDNILATHYRDCGTNFMGAEDEVRKLYEKRDLNGIASPETVLAHTIPTSYNEVVITGKGRTGKKVEIVGVFVKIWPNGEYVNKVLARQIESIGNYKGLPAIRIDEAFLDYKDSLKIEDIYCENESIGFNKWRKRYLFELGKIKRMTVFEYGGKKSYPMNPEERKEAIANIKKLLEVNHNENLEKMVRKVEEVSDQSLEEAIKSRREDEKYQEENLENHKYEYFNF